MQVLEKLGVEVRLEDVEFGSEEEENVVAKAVRRSANLCSSGPGLSVKPMRSADTKTPEKLRFSR